ncbi:MAG: hypothetical protein H8D38_00500 [DPANN group archaeon]|nr:hypothetical protein [DPANN group archaeon]
MKIDRKVIGIGIGAVLVLSLVAFMGIGFATNGTNGIKSWHGFGMHGENHEEGADHMANCPMHNSLTEEQKEAISEKMTELKEQGASSEEIRTAMQSLFEELGIEHNEGGCGGHGFMGGSHSEDEETPEHKANCQFHQAQTE